MVAVVCFRSVNGHMYDTVSTLMADLLNGYDKQQRPVLNQSLPLQIEGSFEILALIVSN